MTYYCVERTGLQEQHDHTISVASSDEEEQDLVLINNGNNDEDLDFKEAMSILTNAMSPGVNNHPV